MKEYRTVCPYDCPDQCSILANIEDNRLLSVRGDASNPRTRGFLCRKTAHYEQMVNHPDRILTPLLRTGKKGSGRFAPISWEKAIDIITSRWKTIIRDYGPEAILPYSYAGTEGKIQNKCGEAFFHYMGASKLKRTICASGKGAGWSAVMGSSPAMPSERLAESDRILVWGSNLAATRTHELPYIQEARKKGAGVTLIETYRSPAASYCDDLLLVRPGSDGALALAVLHVLEKEGLTDRDYIRDFVQGYDLLQKDLPRYTPEWAEGITGLPTAAIYDLARSLGKADRPAILLGSGPARQPNGAMNVRCICAIPAVLGSRRKGFGVTGTSQAGPWGNLSGVTRPDFDRKNARTINMMQLADALDPQKTDPPVQSLYVYNSNPLNVTASQAQVEKGLLREDLFTVVHERFLTDTARYADIILPAVFSLESFDVFGSYGYNVLQYAPKRLDPPGECKSNWDTFCLLAKAMGWTDPYFSLSEEEKCLEFLDRGEGQLALLSDAEWDRLLAGFPITRPLEGTEEIRTPSGRIMLCNPALSDPLIGYRPLPESSYPLHLVAAPSRYSLNSTFTTQTDLMEKRGPMTLLINKEDARVRGIKDGSSIRGYNELAAVIFTARLMDDILPGTVVAEGVYNKSSAPNGYTVNALFSQRLSDLGDATTMNGNFVEIEIVRK